MGGLLRTIVVLVVIVAIAAGALLGFGWYSFTSAGPTTVNGQPRAVSIPTGASTQRIAAELSDAGVINSEFVFTNAARFLKPNLRAGEFEIKSGASIQEVFAALSSGKTLLHKITIAEGLTTRMILRQLLNEDVLAGTFPDVIPAEGTLLPDTYNVPRGMTRTELLKRMADAHDKALDKLWEARAPGLPISSKAEAVNLASIVEKETGIAEERHLVAAVFVNRLKKGMRLQSDPTIIYGLTGGEPLGHGLRRSEIDKTNPYSTYQIDRLPPTPICNPGFAALEATLNPAASDALYFVADGSGGHAFVSSLSEHNKNVGKLRQLERDAAKPKAGSQPKP